MLSEKCINAYRAQYPEDDCGYDESTGDIMIESTDGKLFCPSADETDESFLERLSRSSAAGRNLFYKEWRSFEYQPECEY
ncbi:MAG: hypothetical protein IJ512_05395 [Ruminococcus sp.]|nr:hypothetical protein [Ruminococcus sp.]